MPWQGRCRGRERGSRQLAAPVVTLAQRGSCSAREAIRWSYYGGVIALLLAQIVVILFWPMDGLAERIRTDIAARD